MPKCKRLHNAGVSNIRFLSNLFWNAYERQHWSLVCAVLELLCASIMRQKPGFEVPHHTRCVPCSHCATHSETQKRKTFADMQGSNTGVPGYLQLAGQPSHHMHAAARSVHEAYRTA